MLPVNNKAAKQVISELTEVNNSEIDLEGGSSPTGEPTPMETITETLKKVKEEHTGLDDSNNPSNKFVALHPGLVVPLLSNREMYALTKDDMIGFLNYIRPHMPELTIKLERGLIQVYHRAPTPYELLFSDDPNAVRPYGKMCKIDRERCFDLPGRIFGFTKSDKWKKIPKREAELLSERMKMTQWGLIIPRGPFIPNRSHLLILEDKSYTTRSAIHDALLKNSQYPTLSKQMRDEFDYRVVYFNGPSDINP